ncbi:diguanylate cyclase domain-containing protein [Chitinimonas sp.]|uniref:diguanylate cyclase domain-containing protein n=1 Tax=Chitinimonas sp. TaxID=1934313 RepID=UPI0039C88586
MTGNEVTISLGVAHWPSSDDDLATVIRKADIALYEAKHQGRNRVAVAALQQPAG